MPEKEIDQDYQEEQEILELKRMIRSRMRRLRRETSPEIITLASDRIQKAVIKRPEFQEAGAVGCYQALPFEVQTRRILQQCIEDGKRIAVPAYNEQAKRYELVWMDAKIPLVQGRWNIPEPKELKPAGVMDLDCIIVPALAYDKNGGRLGHGGGHYDRMLGSWSGIKIGIAFELQIHENVPLGSQDIPVDIVITEAATYEA